MSKANQEIKNNIKLFNHLRTDMKVVSDSQIQLTPKKSNVRWLNGVSSVKHEIVNDITLIVERNIRDRKYGVKLHCNTLCSEPFFRFDSDGPAHRNSDTNTPLEKQIVTTPHFNTFDGFGKPIAYKNDALNKEKDSVIIANDINFGVALFCIESNCKLIDGKYPNVIDKIQEIEFDENISLTLDQIKFE